MKIKKFLVQIESGDNTRWIADEPLLRRLMKDYIAALCQHQTEGKIPKVTVTKEN